MRRAWNLLIVLAMSLALAGQTQAQSYPVKPVRIVVGFAAGGSIDIVARILANRLTDFLGQPVIVDNRAGAAGNIAADHVAKSTPNGYTLLLGSATPFAAGISIYKKLPYDPRTAWAPIALLVEQPMVMTVHPSIPAKNLKEFIALAKAQPGKLHYGTTGVGGGHHIRGEMFIMYSGVQLTPVPYRGGAPATTALLRGEIDVMFDTVPTTIDHIKTGRVRAIGVMSANRLPTLPDVPTLSEAGLTGFDFRGWMALAAPAGTPSEIIGKLNAETNRALKDPDVRKRLEDLGLIVTGGTVEAMTAFIEKEIALYAKIVKAAGIPPQ